MTQAKIKLTDLRRIVNEELSIYSESVDHAAVKDVVTAASKLMAAIETFNTSAPEQVIAALSQHLEAASTTLEDMISTPGSYVSKPKPERKVVSLKPVKSKVKLESRRPLGGRLSRPKLMQVQGVEEVDLGGNGTFLVYVTSQQAVERVSAVADREGYRSYVKFNPRHEESRTGSYTVFVAPAIR